MIFFSHSISYCVIFRSTTWICYDIYYFLKFSKYKIQRQNSSKKICQGEKMIKILIAY